MGSQNTFKMLQDENEITTIRTLFLILCFRDLHLWGNNVSWNSFIIDRVSSFPTKLSSVTGRLHQNEKLRIRAYSLFLLKANKNI